MAKIDEVLRQVDIGKVSDIHLTSNVIPMVRVDGKLINLSDEILSHEKVSTYIQDLIPNKFDEFLEKGEIDFKYNVEGTCNFRVNAYKCKDSYSICMRIIKENVPNLSSLCSNQAVANFTNLHDGLVLVTGPTGSGKSTTLASMINEINANEQKHIITLEDPIEYIHKNKKSMINQREIGVDSNSYVNALRAALRQDPDVILLGEMRDSETIETALRAAQTGHLVFSTLHNMGAANSIYRIINSFEGGHQKEVTIQLSSLLRGVISQTLLPHASGKGRVAAMEVMVCTPSIRNIIREGNIEQINSFIQMGSKYGMQTLDMDIKRLLLEGEISSEVYQEWQSSKIDK